MYKSITALLFGAMSLFMLPQSFSQSALLKDINPGVGWVNYEEIFEIGEVTYFMGTSGNGREIWSTDGTTAGTNELIDLNPGFPSSEAQYFTQLGDKWLFSATEGLSGVELWMTDGTASGTMQVKDIHTTASSEPTQLIEMNGKVYFTANDGSKGFELWMSDGTTSGTEMVADINSGADGSFPKHLTVFNGRLYFQANNGTHGAELWSTDGTTMGTSMLSDIWTDSISSLPEQLLVAGDLLFFTADNGSNGKELWRTDGTASGTQMVEDISVGIGTSNPKNFYAVADRLYFLASDAMHGLELWMTDGNQSNPAVMVNDLVPSVDSSDANNFIVVENHSLYFSAKGAEEGFELWRSDALTGQTYIVKDIYPGFGSSSPFMLGNLGDILLFRALDDTHGEELWASDGTEANTRLLKDINDYTALDSTNSSPSFPAIVGDQLYFSAFAYDKGWQIWRTDGTEVGTNLETFVNQDTIYNTFFIPSFVKKNGETLIIIDFSDDFGQELWTFSIAPLQVSLAAANGPICHGDSTGSIQLTIGGGLGPADLFTYKWDSPLATGANPSGLPAGLYNYTIIDCANKRIEGEVELSEPNELAVEFDQAQQPNCFGGNEGLVEASVSGGVGPYQYIWDNGDTTAAADNLAAGVHVLTITDANGCQLIDEFEVAQPDQLDGSIILERPISCHGDDNALLIANASGGTGPFQFDWSTMEVGEEIETAMGTYQLTITDAAGCQDTTSIMITEPSLLVVETTVVQQVQCAGEANGQATATATGGIPGYSYTWDNGDETATTDGLTAGIYRITISDENGCQQIDSIEITQPDTLRLNTVQIDAVSCLGTSDGSAIVRAEGGTGLYTYAWTSGSVDSIASGLASGEQGITVTDANGCESTTSLVIPGAKTEALVLEQVACNGMATGAAMVEISGGISTYSYLWSTGDTTAMINQLAVGVYSVTIQDAANCMVVDSVTITEPSAMALTNAFTAPPVCYGENSGSLTIFAEGGTAPYTYNWSTGTSSGTGFLTGLSGDSTYCVSIVDANGCPALDTCLLVSNPAELVANFTDIENASCASVDLCDGQAMIVPTGGSAGTGVYNFNWSSGETTQGSLSEAIELCAGWNSVVVDDGICFITDSVLIESPPAIEVSISSQSANAGSADGSASASVSGGTPPYAYSWNTMPVQTDSIATDLSAGTYVLTITDANGCTHIDSVVVEMLVGLEALEGLEQLLISPNPSQGDLLIEYVFDQPSSVSLRIFDALGRLVHQAPAQEARQSSFEVDMSAHAAGIYLLRLETDKGSLTRSWVLQ